MIVAVVLAGGRSRRFGTDKLRQRVDEPFGRAALQTVRLVGYRLDPQGG